MITAYVWWKDPKLLERRVNAGSRAETEKYQKVIQLFASLSFIGVLLPSLDHRFFWSKAPLGAVVAGDFLVAFGFLAVYLVFKQNTYTSATIEVVSGQQVVSTGLTQSFATRCTQERLSCSLARRWRLGHGGDCS
jgi:protein-S-isoprenylcysteine O-methyltransferase Ste14